MNAENNLFSSDWPAWIALATAVVSPVLTVYLNNRHALKMEKLKFKTETLKSTSILISEITNSMALKPSEFSGFSTQAVSALQICDEETNRLFLYGASQIAYIKSDMSVLTYPLSLCSFGEEFSDGKCYYYFEWAEEMCKRLISCQNATLREQSQLSKAVRQILHWLRNLTKR